MTFGARETSSSIYSQRVTRNLASQLRALPYQLVRGPFEQCSSKAGVTIIVIPTTISLVSVGSKTALCFRCGSLHSHRDGLFSDSFHNHPCHERFRNDSLVLSSTRQTQKKICAWPITPARFDRKKQFAEHLWALGTGSRIRKYSTGKIWKWSINQPVGWNGHRSDYCFVLDKAAETIQTAWWGKR